MIDARAHLRTLVGQEIQTLTSGKPNRILRIEGDDVIVGTGRTPGGRPVPIEWLQDAVDLLLREGEVGVDVETLGHRGAFVGAFLATLPGTVVELTSPRQIRLVGRGHGEVDEGAPSLPPIVLRSGVRIDDTLELALTFVEQDGSYQSYDRAPVAQDDVLAEPDIRVANAMIARMSPRVIAAIYQRASVINAALAEIPPDASLAAPDDEIPWQELEALMRAMDGIPEVRLARQTKVLHKKRPALIPILDSVLETYLQRVDQVPRRVDAARYAVELVRSYKRELDANLVAIQALQSELRRRGIDLTECRLLDLFLWAYSGTYTPLFLRDEASRQPAPAPVAVDDAGGRAIDVEVFRDDEAGYLSWLTAHPGGFVLNTARSPRPNYLILHRATCRTITGRPTRGGPWTGPYIKVCADDELQIAAWTGRTVGAPPTRCGICFG